MDLTQDELEDLAFKLLVCTDAERYLIEESLTDWQLNEVNRIMESILETYGD